jgi:hypothetical protein
LKAASSVSIAESSGACGGAVSGAPNCTSKRPVPVLAASAVRSGTSKRSAICAAPRGVEAGIPKNGTKAP